MKVNNSLTMLGGKYTLSNCYQYANITFYILFHLLEGCHISLNLLTTVISQPPQWDKWFNNICFPSNNHNYLIGKQINNQLTYWHHELIFLLIKKSLKNYYHYLFILLFQDWLKHISFLHFAVQNCTFVN